MKNNETNCNATLRGFFTYGFSSLLFLRAEEKAVLTVCTADFSSKSFQPKGQKIFGDQKICAGDQI